MPNPTTEPGWDTRETISSLVAKLQAIRAKHGDLLVNVMWDAGYASREHGVTVYRDVNGEVCIDTDYDMNWATHMHPDDRA